jgi:eukaryotic-like serine/threonine-protein kinase
MPDACDRRLRVLGGVELPERYAIRRPIASGGMASVWCARDHVLGRNVAIKLISQPFARDKAALRRFNREARAAARLSSHRHVVTIYDVGHAIDRDTPFGRPFIVMELLAGGTVADALHVGAVTRQQAVQWLGEAAAALDYAHSQGVIHRDIKPANMLLDGERILHVADFGIARLATEDTVAGKGQMLGTAAYIAPEQVLGQPATEASDRYALAVAAFELLARRRPFQAEQSAAQARQHLDEDPPAASRLAPELPRSLDPVLARGMAKRPEQRWASATELAEAIAAALSPSTHPAGAGATRRGAGSRTGRPTPAAAPRPARPVPGAPAPVAPRTRAPLLPRPRRPRRGLALGALAAAALGVGVAAAASGTFSPSHHSASNGPARGLRAATPSVRPARAHTARRHRAARPPATSTAPATTSTVEAKPAGATTPPPTADELQARGHELLADGNLAAAIPVLRQAVNAAPPTSLTYAYALFDLGRSLRLAGDPRDAVTILWQRMQIPNQTDVVRAELQLALRALGRQAGRTEPPARPAPPAGRGEHRGHGHGGRGPDGQDHAD